MFERFVQQPQALDRSQGGIGFGLSIVRSLVQLHGGSVSAHSDGIGHGSEFVVALPLVLSNEERGRSSTQKTLKPVLSAKGRVDRQRILVVDDNEDAAEALAALLAELGHEVKVAHDGPSALQVTHAFQPSICLLDIGLPVMDGYELARHLRKDAGLSEDVRLIAVTGYGQEGDRERSQQAGFQHHIVKPVDFDALSRIIDR